MQKLGLRFLPHGLGRDVLHVVATDGFSLCGLSLDKGKVAREKASGDVCALCARAAKKHGYYLPNAFIQGYPSGTPEADLALRRAARDAGAIVLLRRNGGGKPCGRNTSR